MDVSNNAITAILVERIREAASEVHSGDVHIAALIVDAKIGRVLNEDIVHHNVTGRAITAVDSAGIKGAGGTARHSWCSTVGFA